MNIKRENTVIADVYLKTTSYTTEEINGDFTAYIEFDVREPINLKINDYIEYEGNSYYIRYKENITKAETSLGYSYQVKLYHEQYRMQDVAFFMYDTPEFKKHFNTYNGNVEDIQKLIVVSMNRICSEEGKELWLAGWFPANTRPMTFDFKDKMCSEVVNDVIEAYDIEYWVDGKTLNFGKREFDYQDGDPIFKQGEGFKSLSVKSIDDTPPITRLYAYGGDQNINPKLEEEGGYGHGYLLLPKDAEGERPFYLEKNRDKYGIVEEIVQFPDIFPKRTFHVTEKDNERTFRCDEIDFDISAEENRFVGVPAVVTFQDGGLAGYDLAITAWENSMKQIVVEVIEEQEYKVPGDINFDVGDRFIITGIKMPQQFITEAEQDLLEEAQEYLDERCDIRYQFDCVCDEIYFAENDISIKCGQKIWIVNEKLGIDRDIRCTAIKRYIENDGEKPYRYEITVSDFLAKYGFRQIVNEVKNIPNRIYNGINNLRNPNFFKDVKNNVAKYLGYYDYADMVDAAKKGETIIEGGHINTQLLEAEAVFAHVVTAELIAALEIITGNLTVIDGAKIGGFEIQDGSLTTPNNYMKIKKDANILWDVESSPAGTTGLKWESGTGSNKKDVAAINVDNDDTGFKITVNPHRHTGNNHAGISLFDTSPNSSTYGAQVILEGLLSYRGLEVGTFTQNSTTNASVVKKASIILYNQSQNLTLPQPIMGPGTTGVMGPGYFGSKTIHLVNTGTSNVTVSGFKNGDFIMGADRCLVCVYVSGVGWFQPAQPASD